MISIIVGIIGWEENRSNGWLRNEVPDFHSTEENELEDCDKSAFGSQIIPLLSLDLGFWGEGMEADHDARSLLILRNHVFPH